MGAAKSSVAEDSHKNRWNAGEASGALYLDASPNSRRYNFRRSGVPAGIWFRVFKSEWEQVFDVWSEAYLKFPPIDDPDVQFMLSEAWGAYASAHPLSYPRESVYAAWREEWAAVVWGMTGDVAISELTREAVEAAGLAFNGPIGPQLPTWRKIIHHLDEIAGRRPSLGGMAMIRPDEETGWRVPHAGERKRACLVIPIWSGTSRLRLSAKRRIQCLDLVAIDPSIPERWRVRTGLVSILGDLADLDEAYSMHLPVRLVRNPLQWLKRGGLVSGCYCVLDWDDVEAQHLLTWSYSLVAEDEDHARELHKRLNGANKVTRPKLLIDDAEQAA